MSATLAYLAGKYLQMPAPSPVSTTATQQLEGAGNEAAYILPSPQNDLATPKDSDTTTH